MELQHLLFVHVLMTYTFTSALWFIAGTWMGLSRKAAANWLHGNITAGLALVLLLLDTGLPGALCQLMSASLLLISALLFRRGLQSFFRQPQALGRQVLVGAVPVLLNFALWLPSGLITTGIVSSCLVAAAVLVKAAIDTHAPLAREFRPAAAWTSSAVLGGCVLYCVCVAAAALMHRFDLWPMPDASILQPILISCSSTLSISMSFVLGYIVVMRLVHRLQHLSQHDSLTGLLNRRAIENSLDKEAQRLLRFGGVYSVMLLDIDHFKRINDSLGHAAGDAVLRTVASLLRSHAREIDRVARYGGEEFCVLLPHTDLDGAWQAAERLRCAVQSSLTTWQEGDIAATISIGLVCANDPQETLHALLKRADEALYQAKAAGRNRVVSAPMEQAA